jgi:hypothetical protein
LSTQVNTRVYNTPKNTSLTIEIGQNKITFREDDDIDDLKRVFSHLDAKAEISLDCAKAAAASEEEA